MSAREAMWVGLKLLGLYFLVTAVTNLATWCHSLYGFYSDTTGPLSSYLFNISLTHFVQAGVSLVAGVLFVCCTGMIVARPDSKNFPSDVDN